MRIPLPRPVTMVGRITECVLVWYRTPAESVRSMAPAGFELMTVESGGRVWAFWNIVVCRVERMRPGGWPGALGVSYHHAAYRLMVSVSLEGGPAQRGLYFLRSDADNSLMAWGGNLTSDFKFNRARVELGEAEGRLRAKVRSKDRKANAELEIDPAAQPEPVPGSIFGSLDEARKVLKYEPMGLAPGPRARKVRLAEVFRDESAWDERAVQVVSARWEYLARLGQNDIVLELATRVAPIDYRWRLGRVETMEAGNGEGAQPRR
ncbi:MAG: DUF2071 domain-containing protein [Phycisphaerales bacterium]|nr:DUF2071 domain-containing protein [Phycisphaerales bacterium]